MALLVGSLHCTAGNDIILRGGTRLAVSDFRHKGPITATNFHNRFTNQVAKRLTLVSSKGSKARRRVWSSSSMPPAPRSVVVWRRLRFYCV